MSQSNLIFDFSADRPLENPEYDRLGMKLFAENLAQCIIRMHSSSGIVIGLHGSWGSGKSTVLNFVKHYLANQAEDRFGDGAPSTDSIRTLDFNPWWFSEDEDLVRRFIWSLIAEVDKEPGKGDKLVAGLKQFAAAAETLPKVGDYVKPINFLIRTYGKQPLDFYASKENLGNLLRDQKDRFVIFVDDVDRLSPREVCQVLRLVKSVADLPNVTYVMAFDPTVVGDAIKNELLCEDGSNYVDKIVQVAFSLPLPDDIAMRRLLDKSLADDVRLTSSAIESTRYQRLYEKGLMAFLKTPRDICRLVNALRLTYPMVQGTVDLVDFIGIEAVRLFRPREYELIRSNKELFAGPSATIAPQILSSPHPEQSAIYKFHTSWLFKGSKSEEWAKSFYSMLFPILGAFWGQPIPGNWDVHAAANQRICDADSFDRYFKLHAGAGGLSIPKMLNLIEASVKEDEFEASLLSLASERRPDGAPRIVEFVSKLPMLMADSANQIYLPSVAGSLLSCGEALCQAWSSVKSDGRNPNGWSQRDLVIQLWLHLDSLLRLLPRDQLMGTLLKVIGESRELTLIVMVVTDLHSKHPNGVGQDPLNKIECASHDDVLEDTGDSIQPHRAPPDSGALVVPDSFDVVKAAMMARLNRASIANEIESSPFELIIIDRWLQLDSDAAKAWLAEQCLDAHKLIRIIGKALHRPYSMEMKRSVLVVDPDTLKEFFDINSVEGLLKTVSAEAGFSEDDVKIAKTYLRGLDSRRKGRDPTLDASLFVEWSDPAPKSGHTR